MPPRRPRDNVETAGAAPSAITLELAPPITALNLRQTTFLAAALRDTQHANASSRARLAPNEGLAMQMLKELSDCGAVVLDLAMAAYPAWAASPKKMLPTWRLADTFHGLHSVEEQVRHHLVVLARAPSAEESLLDLWRELAIAETTALLGAELADHRFDEAWALTAIPAIDRGLRRLSVSQMSYLCWLAVRETASRFLRFPGSVSTLADGLVTYIDQRVNRALNERWIIRDWIGYKRVDSSVAQIFADEITTLGPDYLGEPPSRNRISRGRASGMRVTRRRRRSEVA
jgi:hypothetical protein